MELQAIFSTSLTPFSLPSVITATLANGDAIEEQVSGVATICSTNSTVFVVVVAAFSGARDGLSSSGR